MFRSVERLEAIEELLKRLAKAPGEVTIMRDLNRQFHWLAGSGGIYGFAQITKVGLHGEQLCEQLVQAGRPITKVEWDKCKALLDALKAAFSLGEDDQRITMQRELPRLQDEAVDIVVIDGDQANFLMLTRILEEHGMLIRSARFGAAGFQAITEKMPRAIIIGLPLPDGNGYEIVDQVRQLHRGEEPVIFMVSKEAGFIDKVQAIHCGADGYFEVPVDWELMSARLKYLLDRNKPEMYKILSVEDDPDQGEFIKAVLESGGYDIQVCEDPMNFEEALLSTQPDLVLLDIMLPGVTGFELARFLRQDERYATLPILFLSTQNQLDAHVESARAGGDDHLIKPIAPTLLLSAVASRLERARFLKNLLHRDGLTRLLTHGAFMESANAVVSQCKRNLNKLACLIILDLDRFQNINSRYGYVTGDKVLTCLAALLRQRVRQSDKVGRYGGEELIVIVEDLEEHDAVKLATRLLEDFSSIEHRAPDGSSFKATFSAGLALFDPKVMDLERWRRLAEQALTAAKAGGRNCVMKAQIGRR